MSQYFWTHAQAEQLRVLRLADLTFAEIAERLGISRHAVAGKVKRLKAAGHL